MVRLIIIRGESARPSLLSICCFFFFERHDDVHTMLLRLGEVEDTDNRSYPLLKDASDSTHFRETLL
jgi:hypothetical protein